MVDKVREHSKGHGELSYWTDNVTELWQIPNRKPWSESVTKCHKVSQSVTMLKVSQSVILGSSLRKGQERSGKAWKGQVKSGKVMEGHGRSYPNTRCVNNVRKVTGGGGWPVGL